MVDFKYVDTVDFVNIKEHCCWFKLSEKVSLIIKLVSTNLFPTRELFQNIITQFFSCKVKVSTK